MATKTEQTNDLMTEQYDDTDMTKNEMIGAMVDAGHITATEGKKMSMPRCKKAEVVAAFNAFVAEMQARAKAEQDAINGKPAKAERKPKVQAPTKAEQKHGKAGLQLHTEKNRTTGTACSMYNSEAAGIDGEKYAMVCEDHNFIVTTPKRKVAGWEYNHPENWCEACQKLHAEGRKFEKAAGADAPVSTEVAEALEGVKQGIALDAAIEAGEMTHAEASATFEEQVRGILNA